MAQTKEEREKKKVCLNGAVFFQLFGVQGRGEDGGINSTHCADG